MRLIWLIFSIFTIWWVCLQTGLLNQTDYQYQLFTGSYGIMALYGGVLGIFIGDKWGGMKSLLGRAITMLAAGLLAQEVGQVIYYVYIYVYKVEVPYPSLGDIGFFSTIIFYTYGIILLAKVSGVRLNISSFTHKAWAAIIPLIIVVISYYFFLRSYEFDWSNPLIVFLDFAYPVGQAINMSLAIVTLLLTHSVLGGLMKSKIRLLIFALFLQYCADFMFLYQAHYHFWTVGGINDYIYFLAYFAMSVGLIQIYSIYSKVKNN